MISYRKLYVLISCFLLFLVSITAFAGAAKIEIKEFKVDLQELKSGSVITKEVKINNAGKEDLIIKSIRCTCDCLTATISSEKIIPGESTLVTFNLDTNDAKIRKGKFTKYIFIQSNDSNRPVSRIIISGTVGENADFEEKGKEDVE